MVRGKCSWKLVIVLLMPLLLSSGLLGMGQGFRQVVREAFVQRPTASLLSIQKMRSMGSSIHKVSRHLLSYVDSREQWREHRASPDNGLAALSLAASI